MLRIVQSAHLAMISHAIGGLPNEACGLMGGPDPSIVTAFVATRNADASARTYSIGADGFLAADRVFDPKGLQTIGVVHSHTHTDPYPSPTDVAAADNPFLIGWHYVIISLRETEPMVRSWILDGGTIVETPVEIVAG